MSIHVFTRYNSYIKQQERTERSLTRKNRGVPHKKGFFTLFKYPNKQKMQKFFWKLIKCFGSTPLIENK